MKSPKATSTRHQLPIGIAGFEPASAEIGSLAFATDTDTVRVKTSTGWQDLTGGGGGGPPTGPAGGSLAGTYPNPTAPMAGDVSGDISSSTVDKIQGVDVNPSGSSGDVMTLSGGNLVMLPPASTSPGFFNVYTPPTSPDADNQEFDGTSVTTGMRMWDFTTKAQIVSPATSLQTLGTFPAGAVAAWQQGVRSSCLSVQSNQSNGVFVSKALTTPLVRGSTSGQGAYIAETRMLLWLKDIGLRSGSAGGWAYQFGLAADNAGDPDWNNRLVWIVYNYMDSGGGWETLIRCLSVVSGSGSAALWEHDITGTNPAGGSYASNSYGRRIENERFGFYMGPNATFGYFGAQHTQIVGNGGSGGITALNGDGAHAFWGIQYAVEAPIARFDIDYFRCYRGTDPNTPLVP